MRKVLFASVFLLAGCALFAQSGAGYIAVLPGYQFSGENVNSGFAGSLDYGHPLNKNLGIHLALWVNQGQYDFTYEEEGNLGRAEIYRGEPNPDQHYPFSQAFTVFEFGPELTTSPARWGQAYFQANLGYTMGLSRALDVWPRRAIRDDVTFGFAVGYRRFFKGGVGLAGQIGFHQITSLGTDQWDARVGIVIKLP